MSDKSNSYFTIGEFANLFGISKQTLFYYEKNKIFSPCFVEDNGYRYYSLDQYFVFEIIVTLRKLGVSLKEIRNYVNNRSVEALQKLFADKALEYELQIEFLQRNRQNLLINLSRLKQAAEVKSDRITLEDCEDEYYVATSFAETGKSTKGQIQRIAQHNLPFAKSEIFNEYFMGYIVPPTNLLTASPHTITQIFTQISYPDEFPKAIKKAKGLYAKIATADGYHTSYQRAIDKLLEFIRRNELDAIGNAYIVQLKNYWSSSNTNEYITQISIHVEYTK